MVFNPKITTKSAKETSQSGQTLAEQLLAERGEVKPWIICLYGELGSGKTTFAQGFARGLGISSRLLSPTFIIVRRYDLPEIPGFLYHLDLYRLKNKTDLEGLGLDEIFTDVNSFVLIEWAEKLGELLSANRLDIKFNVLPDGNHKIEITKHC